MEVVRIVSTPTFTIDYQVEEESKRKDIAIGPLMWFAWACWKFLGRCMEPLRSTWPLGLQAPSLGILLNFFWMMPRLPTIIMGNLLNGYGKTKGMLLVYI